MVAHLPDDGLLTAVVRLTSSQVYHVEVSMLSTTRALPHARCHMELPPCSGLICIFMSRTTST